MPKIAERRKVLDGRAEVITYSRDESAWYYREPDGSGGYRQKRLKEALSEADAVAMALDVWSEMRTKQQLIKTGQKLVKQFCLFLSSGEMDRCLSRFAPAAQAHMIDDIEAVKLLLEELISKHQPIEVTPIH